MEWITTESFMRKGGQTAFRMKWRTPDKKVVTFTVMEGDTVEGIVEEFSRVFVYEKHIIQAWEILLASHFPRKVGRFFVYSSQ